MTADHTELSREELFERMPLLRFEKWGLYRTPDGLVWAEGGYPE